MSPSFYSVYCCLLICANALLAQPKLSLADFGWDKARNGAERAKVLYDAQSEAVRRGKAVDYAGIGRVELEITKSFKSIPLTGQDDFMGIEFIVINNAKDIALFELKNKATPIDVSKSLLDGTRFSAIPELQKGENLLIIKDNNLWVDNRVGYKYGHTRKDILLIKDGKSLNRVISSYDNEASSPLCSFIPVRPDSSYIANFTLTRADGSLFKTFCLVIQGIAHLCIDHIVINTPKSELSGDYAIKILDCADVSLRNITINNTYSQNKAFGYGISINNTWSVHFDRVCGAAAWGVLGNNNMSDTFLSNCRLNRFDIHCYGKNVSLSDCIFDGGAHGWYCGGSSIYGIIKYDRCHFVNCTPIAFGDSYKTAVGVDVVFNDCVFDVTKKKYYVFGTDVLNNNINPRPGLSRKCLPNIEINNLTINVPKGVKEVFLYKVGSVSYPEDVGYLSKVRINGLLINCPDNEQKVDFKFINVPVKTENKLSIDVNNLSSTTACLNPVISSNRKNKVKITKSTFQKVERGKGLKLKIAKCNIAQ